MKFLVAEDEHMVRYLLCELLHEIGVDQVIECETIEKALSHLDRHETLEISAIFLDLNMDGLGGLDFLEKIKANEVYKDVPIFIITGDPATEKKKACFNYQISSFISKPFSMSQIEDCVRFVERLNSEEIAELV